MIIRGILTRSTFNLSTTGLKVLCTETNDPTENIMFFLHGEIARTKGFRIPTYQTPRHFTDFSTGRHVSPIVILGGGACFLLDVITAHFPGRGKAPWTW